MPKSRSGCLRWVILLALGGVGLFLFRFEIDFIKNLILSILSGGRVDPFPQTQEATRISIFISENILAVIFFTILWHYWIGGTVFAVQTNQQIVLLMGKMIQSLWGRSAPMIFVREGVLVGEVGQAAHSAIFVDLESAVVIESAQVRTPALFGIANWGGKFTAQSLAPRVAGPGLVILRRGERLRDVVSLRNQFRLIPDVHGRTSDGIELSTNTYVSFNLSQRPTVIQVAYHGDPDPENLHVLRIDPQTRKITAIQAELDRQDQEEIHQFAQNFLYCIDPNSPLDLGADGQDFPPYFIDEQRVLAGVYSRARNVSDRLSANHWTDLPAMVTAEAFRNIIARYSLDELYLPDDPKRFPLQTEIKPEFSRRIRNLGVISFQFLQRQDGGMPIVGQRVDHRSFRISEVRALSGEKVLRKRGIKVLFAGFSELTPTDPKVNQQRLETWRARWQREVDLILADQGQEVGRIKENARANRRRDLVDTFSNLFSEENLSEEALTMQVFRELESLASDPTTRQMLPKDTMEQLRTIRLWLMPEILDEDQSDGSSQGGPQ